MKCKDFRDINCLANTKMRFRIVDNEIKISSTDGTIFDIEDVVLYFLKRDTENVALCFFKRGTKDDFYSCENPKLYEEFDKLDDFDILSILYYWNRLTGDSYDYKKIKIGKEHELSVIELAKAKKSYKKNICLSSGIGNSRYYTIDFYALDRAKQLVDISDIISDILFEIVGLESYEDELINRGYDLSKLYSTPDDKGSKGSK